MSSSAINQSVFQAKVSGIQNQADSTSIYSNGVWSFKNSTALTSVTITDAGNVGIGTSSPATKLDINGGIRIPALSSLQMGNGSTYVYTDVAANGSFIIGTSSTERMRIDASGNLSVNGAFQTTPNGVTTIKRTDVTSGSGADGLLYRDGSNDLCGYVSINATANTVTYTNSSDARLKTNHRNFDGLALVGQMKPSKYERICNPGVDEIGLVAQELALLLPEAVSEGSDDVNEKPWGVDYGRITPVLVKAIQEQQAQIEALKAEVAALKAP